MFAGYQDGMLQKAIILRNSVRGEKERKAAEDLVEEIRGLTYGTSQLMLRDLGMAAALEWALQLASGESGQHTSLSLRNLERDDRFPYRLEQVLFRVADEAISNAGQHSYAESVEVILEMGHEHLSVTVKDTGVGALPFDRDIGLGTRLMEHLVEQVGGSLEITTERDTGTTVAAKVPLYS